MAAHIRNTCGAPIVDISIEELEADPYPTYAYLRSFGGLVFVSQLNMYWATRYDDVSSILFDSENFVVGTETSLIQKTFGQNVLTVEGDYHRYLRQNLLPMLRHTGRLNQFSDLIALRAAELLDGIDNQATLGFDLRGTFARRLPVILMLDLFGIAQDQENTFRAFYDKFEAALANFTNEPTIEEAARQSFDAFQTLCQTQMDEFRASPKLGSMLSDLVSKKDGLSDDEIVRNSLITMFGGISTVEALLLNTLFAAAHFHPGGPSALQHDEDIASFIEETARWASPVQSATRHVVGNVCVGEVNLKKGDVVNCMLASANRDPDIFERPDEFDAKRLGVKRHVAFAKGPHTCIGNHLGRLVCKVAFQKLQARFPGYQISLESSEAPSGYEFRQPKHLWIEPAPA
ncbi:MAG: cytochrome P450 [Henriciella sp.]